MRLAALTLVALVGGVIGALAQASDPFSGAEHDADVQAFRNLRTKSLENVTLVYFAFGCRVLPNEISASLLARDAVAPVYASVTMYHQMDSALSTKVLRAKQDGIDQAKEGCAYWKDHIEESLFLRKQAEYALQHPN